MVQTVICIPTYNEKENLEILLPKMEKIIDKHSLDAVILVIDDNSPDGTAETVKKFMNHHSNIDLLFRTQKEGLGKAYIAGFEFAIKKYSPDFIFEMDADLSHPPEVFPEMVNKLITNKVDLIVGSRKISGGGTENWGIHRKIISGGGNLYARIMLGLTIKDVTSGYRGFRTYLLKQIDLQSIDSGGYSFQIELAYLTAKLLKGRTGEVPIVFVDRKHGKSKLGFLDILEFFLEALRLNFFGWRRRKKLFYNS